MFKKVEKIEKKNEEFEKSLNEIKEMLKTINKHYLEEEIVIDVKYVKEGQEKVILIDNGATKLIVSS